MEKNLENYLADRSIERRNAVVMAHMEHVKTIAELMSRKLHPNADQNDIVQAGALGLIKAVERFDPTRGIKFNTFAAHAIRGGIKDFVRENTGFRRGDNHPVVDSQYNLDSLCAESGIQDVDSPEELIREQCGRVPQKLLDVLVLRYANGLTFRKIGVRLGIATSTAGKRHRAGIEFLQQKLMSQPKPA